MQIVIEKRSTQELIALHELYRQEANCQLVRDSYWPRGFLDAYAIEIDGRLAGYGAVANKHYPGTLIEFYTFPDRRRHALRIFRELLTVSAASHIQAQTNVPLMLMMLIECAADIHAENVLFADAFTTNFPCPEEGIFRHRKDSNELPIFEHRHEPEGDWLIEAGGEIVATGGFLSHYNPPYADLFMEVVESRRQRGFGIYLIQELKRACYASGKLPAARSGVTNLASRNTLEKAGLLACGHVVVGSVK